MKRKRLDRDIWRTIVQKRYTQMNLATDRFTGIAALLRIDRASKRSVWKINGQEAAICEDGMMWLEFAPAGENYLVTAMMDSAGNTRVWYVDVIDGIGFSEDGVAYYDDLYADIIFAQDGAVHVDDMDELTAAYEAGKITGAQRALAIKTVRRVKETLCADRASLAVLCAHILAHFDGA